jgi:hypothetical protein
MVTRIVAKRRFDMPHLASIAAVLVLAACTSASGDPVASRGKGKPRAEVASGPIVVELFTSQGCSSCPPADRLLSKLVTAGTVGDREVVPLAFHVDYWNDLGWADPFSSLAWSERQRAYANAMDTGRVYTPQLVIAGRDHVVGSNAVGVSTAIATATAPAKMDASIEWTATGATVTATAPAGADAWVAIYEDAITTAVARGENAGEQLHNDHVVRVFEKVASSGKTQTIEIELDRAWHQLGAVAIAQGKSMAIVGSRALAARP